MLACVAGWLHMAGFMAGAMTALPRKARAWQASSSSAWPCASRAMVAAEAGAMTRACATCPGSRWAKGEGACGSSKGAVYTGAAPSAANVSGVTNFWAEGVRVALTETPASCHWRTRSSARYAATDPHTPRWRRGPPTPRKARWASITGSGPAGARRRQRRPCPWRCRASDRRTGKSCRPRPFRRRPRRCPWSAGRRRRAGS